MPWRRERLPTLVFDCIVHGVTKSRTGLSNFHFHTRSSLVPQMVKKSACNAGNLGSIPGLGRLPGEGNGYLLQYSCLENSMDGGAWQATVHGITKSQTWQQNSKRILKPFTSTVLLFRYYYFGYINIYNCYIFYLDWSLDHYVVSFLIACNHLYFKVYFVWYEYCYYSFILISVCM